MPIRLLIIGLLALLLTRAAETPGRPDRSDPTTPRTLDSAAIAFRRNLAALTSPEFETRKVVRRKIQQQGYVYVLHDVLAGDGLGALIAYLRMKAILEFHLPHNTLYVYASIRQPEIHSWERNLVRTSGLPSAPMAIPLFEHVDFPADPWSKTR